VKLAQEGIAKNTATQGRGETNDRSPVGAHEICLHEGTDDVQIGQAISTHPPQKYGLKGHDGKGRGAQGGEARGTSPWTAQKILGEGGSIEKKRAGKKAPKR